MNNANEIVKAIIREDAILCGTCGHKLAVVKALKSGLGNGTIYLKCQHKSAGDKCKVINQIDL